MNPLQESIKNLVKPMIEEKMQTKKGIILNYIKEANISIVEIQNPKNTGKLILENVPIKMVGGMHIPGPFNGDEVWVSFMDGKLEMPYISGFTDSDYYNNTREKKFKHTSQGAFIPDLLSKGD